MKLFYKNSIILSSLNITIILILFVVVFENMREDKINNILSEKQFEINFKTQDFQNVIHSNSEQTKLLSILPEIQGIVKFTDYDKSTNFQFDKNFWSGLLETKFKTIGKNNPDIHQIQLYDLTGKEMIHIFSQNGKLSLENDDHLIHYMDTDYINKVQKLGNNQILISNISLNIIDNVIETPHRPIQKIITPIFINGVEKLGFLVIHYNMQETLVKLGFSASGNIVIFDNDGFFLSNLDKSKLFGKELGTEINYFIEQPEFQENLEKMDHKFHYDKDEKEYRIWNKIFYDITDNSKFWVMSSITTESELFAPIDNLRFQLQNIVIIFLAGTITVSILISRHMSKPIQELTRKILRVKKGELDIIVSAKGSDEITDLGNAFNSMTKSLIQAQQTSEDYELALSDKLAEFKKLNYTLEDSISISKLNKYGDFTYVNEKFCKLTKYTKDELLGKNYNILKTGFDNNISNNDVWGKILDGNICTNNIKNKAKDDTYFWVKEIIIPITNSIEKTTEFLVVHININSKSETIRNVNK